jgi:hypothetical protein
MADWYKASLSPAVLLLDAASSCNTTDESDVESRIHEATTKKQSLNISRSLQFTSRRSCVLSRHGMVASSQPLATSIGLQWLRDRGANAADTAVVMTAILAVTEPCSTGVSVSF